VKIILAPDSFKGTFTSSQAAAAMADGVRERIPDAQTLELPLADGGDGTLDVLLGGTGGERHTADTSDPLGRKTGVDFALLPGDEALVEMALSSGLSLLTPGERNPWLAGTFGLGQVILAALEHRIRALAVTLGGSATVDGGVGMARALGWKFYDTSGKELLDEGGKILGKISRIDPSGADSRLGGLDVRALCDVTNPLLGPDGAARVFGPQKGAAPPMVERLESGMTNLAARLKEDLGADVAAMPGTGAAGGLGAAVAAFLGGRLVSGIDYVLDTLKFDSLIRDARLVITGEGSFDSQSMGGKAISGVLTRARTAGVPVAVVCGIHRATGNPDLAVFSRDNLPDGFPADGKVDLNGLAWLAGTAAGETLGQ
jgi:glycerate 2-kinase